MFCHVYLLFFLDIFHIRSHFHSQITMLNASHRYILQVSELCANVLLTEDLSKDNSLFAFICYSIRTQPRALFGTDFSHCIIPSPLLLHSPPQRLLTSRQIGWLTVSH